MASSLARSTLCYLTEVFFLHSNVFSQLFFLKIKCPCSLSCLLYVWALFTVKFHPSITSNDQSPHVSLGQKSKETQTMSPYLIICIWKADCSRVVGIVVFLYRQQTVQRGNILDRRLCDFYIILQDTRLSCEVNTEKCMHAEQLWLLLGPMFFLIFFKWVQYVD